MICWVADNTARPAHRIGAGVEENPAPAGEAIRVGLGERILGGAPQARHARTQFVASPRFIARTRANRAEGQSRAFLVTAQDARASWQQRYDESGERDKSDRGGDLQKPAHVIGDR